jgi:unsaturated rhamnogalacturonyl hydrolase
MKHRMVCLAAMALLFGGCQKKQDQTQMVSGKNGPPRSIRETVLAVARHQFREIREGRYGRESLEQARNHVQPAGVAWEYTWGVTLYGLMRTSEATGDRSFAEFALKHNRAASRYFSYLKWMENKYPEAYREQQDWAKTGNPLFELLVIDRLDFCGAMGAQMLEGFLRGTEKPSAEEKMLLEFVADYIVRRQPRTTGGMFWRPEFTNPYINQVNHALDKTVWIDDLYMACPFLVRWFRYTGDSSHLTDAARQVIRMAGMQQDTDGLWFHGNFIGEKKRSQFKWGRGNGWAMVAAVEVLSAMPDGHPDRAVLLDVLRRHIDGVKKCQAASGLWHQVLDRPEVWEETSCSAMFSYSIARAVSRGWISDSYLPAARKAFDGITAKIDEQGRIADICEGTEIGRDLAYYVNRGRPMDDRHGQGAVLLAGAELLEIDAERQNRPH